MAKSQRVKGANFEREVARMFRGRGFDANRGANQSRDAGKEPDVVVHDIPGLWIECKRGGRGAKPLEALAQATQAAPAGSVPVFVGKMDYEPCIMAMYITDFLDLLRKVYPDAVKQLDIEFKDPQPDADQPTIVVGDGGAGGST